jgi:hypothetical protein
MEQGPLRCLQDSYPEQDKSMSDLPTLFFRLDFIIFPFTRMPWKCSISFRFSD